MTSRRLLPLPAPLRVVPLVRSYRLGISIVLATITLSAVISVVIFAKQASPPAGESLGAAAYTLSDYDLIERSGRAIKPETLADDVWIAAFIFTRCPSSCPVISSTMKGLQAKLAGTHVRLVSISVDPEFDTPEVLSEYAKKYAADPERWWFLTGQKDRIYRMILDQFHISVARSSDEERAAGAEQVAHSNRLVLVARGNRVAGTYVSSDSLAVDRLLRDAHLLESEGTWPRQLPEINAGLNATCAVILIFAWICILTGRRQAHALGMISAIVVSALFLACYLVYHYMVGSMPFRGYGPIRVVYFTILLSHTALATLGVVPLVALTVYRAYRQDFSAHVRIARVTFPIWFYVSVTGVVIYWMLYRLDVSPVLG